MYHGETMAEGNVFLEGSFRCTPSALRALSRLGRPAMTASLRLPVRARGRQLVMQVDQESSCEGLHRPCREEAR